MNAPLVCTSLYLRAADIVAFAQGPAKQLLGEEVAAGMLAEQLARKEQGAKWCNCEACSAATELLAKFGRIEL